MKILDNRNFSSLTLDQFKRFATKTQLNEHLVIDAVQETVESFSKAWNMVKELPIKKDVHSAISKHLKTIPLWNPSGK